MKKIVRKFHCRRGASITIAMLLFLLCALAGVSALTMAAANAGRYSHAEEDRQPYYSVTSAALLIADHLNGLTYTSAKIEFDYTHSWKFNDPTPGTSTDTPQRTYTDEYTLKYNTDPKSSTSVSTPLLTKNSDGNLVPDAGFKGKSGGGLRERIQKSEIVAQIVAQCDKIVPYLSVPQEWYSAVWKDDSPDVENFEPKDMNYVFYIQAGADYVNTAKIGVVECTLVMKANYDLLFSFIYVGDKIGDTPSGSYAVNLYWAATVSESPEKGVPEYNYTGDGNTGSVTEKQSKEVEITWKKENVKISRGEADKTAG